MSEPNIKAIPCLCTFVYSRNGAGGRTHCRHHTNAVAMDTMILHTNVYMIIYEMKIIIPDKNTTSRKLKKNLMSKRSRGQ